MRANLVVSGGHITEKIAVVPLLPASQVAPGVGTEGHNGLSAIISVILNGHETEVAPNLVRALRSFGGILPRPPVDANNRIAAVRCTQRQ